jgi:hypothetical protein
MLVALKKAVILLHFQFLIVKLHIQEHDQFKSLEMISATCRLHFYWPSRISGYLYTVLIITFHVQGDVDTPEQLSHSSGGHPLPCPWQDSLAC